MNCKNCSSQLGASAQFCEQCGQSVTSYNKSLRPVLADMLHESLDIDGRLLTTLKTLISKPGQLSLAYREGQRARYTPPLRLYLVISIIFFLLLSTLEPGTHVADSVNPLRTDLYPKLMFALMPLFALLLHLLFRNTFYLSNLVFAIHIHCVAYLVIGLTLPIGAHEQAHPVLIAVQVPFAVYLFGYLPLALKRYYAESWSKTAIKFTVLFLVYVSLMGVSFDYLLHYWA